MTTKPASNISIIVATFNSGLTLETCLSSIKNQTFAANVYIADGGSTDQTMNIVSRYADIVTHAFSEKDNGVFDAWNKALKFVSTDWVMFLGSDDWLDDECFLEKMACHVDKYKSSPDVGYLIPIVEVCSGKVVLRTDNTNFVPEIRPHFMPFTQTGTVHRYDMFSDVGKYDSEFKIAGDYEFFNRTFDKYKAVNVGDCVVKMSEGGLSNSVKARKLLLDEQCRIYSRYKIKLSLSYWLYHFLKRQYYKFCG